MRLSVVCCVLLASACQFVPTAGFATNIINSTAALVDRAIALQLATSDNWTRLLHYSPSARSDSGLESQVIDKRFFLADDGKTNPQAELAATVTTLFGDPQKTDHQSNREIGDRQPRCRFVERERWLRDQLDLPPTDVPSHCTEYYKWRRAVGSHSMSLVFPASYLNSPSSMFGHTLLRFDPEDIDKDSEWLSWSLNFAADTGNENFSAGYAFKGITGGYAGKFSSVPYFTKLQEYGAIENRDIWEYQLDFTPDELDRLLDHAWELRDISFDYYFFRQNCSYRLLELMDYARPSLQLASQFPLTTIPADTVKSVVEAGIVTDTNYRPSLGTGIQTRYQSLNNKHKQWVRKIAADPDVALSADFQTLDDNNRTQLLRIANDLVTYRSRRTTRSKKSAETRLQLLKLISQLPTETTQLAVRPEAPELAHDTQVISTALGRSSSGNYTDLAYRISYHDILDRNTGYLKGAGISLGEVTIRRSEHNSTRLQSLELVKLQSISDRALIFNALSWNLSLGLARDAARNNDRLFGRFDGAVGKSTEILPDAIGYAMIGATAAQYSDWNDRYLDVHTELGLLYYHQRFSSQFELRLTSPQDESIRTTASLTANLPLAKNHAIRTQFASTRASGDRSNTVKFQYRFYF